MTGALLCAAALVLGDILQLKDGRVIEGPPIKKDGAVYRIAFQNGEVVVPEGLVRDAATSEGKPQDLEARRKRLEEAKSRLEWRNRWKTESRHFKFEYTIPPEIFESYKNLLETYYDVFTKKWGIAAPAKVGKLLVCIYHDEDTFHQVSGAPQGVLGYFRFVEPLELHVFYDRRDPEFAVDVLFHEGNHFLTQLIDLKFNYPPWVNESLAEYYGASTWDPKTKKMALGNVQEGRLVVLWDAIAGQEMQGLEDLIREPQFNAIHYAWGWSFVHFLMENPKYSKKFQSYYLALAKGSGVKRVMGGPMNSFREVPTDDQIALLKSTLGVRDLKALEVEWHDYVKNKLKLQTGRGYEEAAQWARRWGMSKKAAKYFKQAVEAGSANPVTYDEYAELLERDGKEKEAIPLLEKAIELDPLFAQAYLRLGRLLGKGDKPQRERGEKLKKLAFEIAPDDPYLHMDLETAKALSGAGK
jgi:tetratricopeptide (TPR) repeat protein